MEEEYEHEVTQSCYNCGRKYNPTEVDQYGFCVYESIKMSNQSQQCPMWIPERS